jgi:hypothetical protein
MAIIFIFLSVTENVSLKMHRNTSTIQEQAKKEHTHCSVYQQKS